MEYASIPFRADNSSSSGLSICVACNESLFRSLKFDSIRNRDKCRKQLSRISTLRSLIGMSRIRGCGKAERQFHVW